MSQDPREAWLKLQRAFENAQRRGMPGGPPKGFFGGAAGLLLLGGAAVFVNNALFNGRLSRQLYCWTLFSPIPTRSHILVLKT